MASFLCSQFGEWKDTQDMVWCLAKRAGHSVEQMKRLKAQELSDNYGNNHLKDDTRKIENKGDIVRNHRRLDGSLRRGGFG